MASFRDYLASRRDVACAATLRGRCATIPRWRILRNGTRQALE